MESGSLASAAGVIEQALGLLEDRERDYGEWFRADVAKGHADVDAGRVTRGDDEFFEMVHARFGLPERTREDR